MDRARLNEWRLCSEARSFHHGKYGRLHGHQKLGGRTCPNLFGSAKGQAFTGLLHRVNTTIPVGRQFRAAARTEYVLAAQERVRVQTNHYGAASDYCASLDAAVAKHLTAGVEANL